MDLGTASRVDELRATIAAADAVVPVGGRTHFEVGGPPPVGVEVGAPAGVVAYDPADLTVTVDAGTTVSELASVLGEADQECVLDPRDPGRATVGGTLAAGLSGPRRLRYGPLRDRVLEVRFVLADGRLVRGGGPTVKNVTGYDLPRLLVGSLGTIGVLVQVILRCQPRPVASLWCTASNPFDVRRRAYRPSCIAWDGDRAHVLLEGRPGEVEDELRRIREIGPVDTDTPPPAWPDGSHRGRISVRPATVAAVGAALGALEGVRWLAEVGVGTIHVATDDSAALARARECAEQQGGWLLREAGDGIDGFGRALPNLELQRRVRAAFDPTGKLSPGRLPL
jgi:glycolate dehydrogenase FAD-binding subunit